MNSLNETIKSELNATDLEFKNRLLSIDREIASLRVKRETLIEAYDLFDRTMRDILGSIQSNEDTLRRVSADSGDK